MVMSGFVGRSAYYLYKLVWTSIDWLYPPQCGGCGTDGSRWCLDCQVKIQRIPSTICHRCGRLLESVDLCDQCHRSPPPYVAVRTWAVFGGSLRNAIHRLKYKGDIALGEILARPLLDMLKALEWEIDLVTPVPIGVARQKERGYNQAALLALPVALGLCKKYNPRALMKIRETRSQVNLSNRQRYENVIDAFLAQGDCVSGKSVLVIDDVTTSGATLESCSFALVNAGARQVFCLTLARSAYDLY